MVAGGPVQEERLRTVAGIQATLSHTSYQELSGLYTVGYYPQYFSLHTNHGVFSSLAVRTGSDTPPDRAMLVIQLFTFATRQECTHRYTSQQSTRVCGDH